MVTGRSRINRDRASPCNRPGTPIGTFTYRGTFKMLNAQSQPKGKQVSSACLAGELTMICFAISHNNLPRLDFTTRSAKVPCT
jgi:hypothetical protein